MEQTRCECCFSSVPYTHLIVLAPNEHASLCTKCAAAYFKTYVGQEERNKLASVLKSLRLSAALGGWVNWQNAP